MNVFFSRPLHGSPQHGLFDASGAGTLQGTACRHAQLRSADNRMTLLNINAHWQEIAHWVYHDFGGRRRSVASTGEEER